MLVIQYFTACMTFLLLMYIAQSSASPSCQTVSDVHAEGHERSNSEKISAAGSLISRCRRDAKVHQAEDTLSSSNDQGL